MFVGPIENDMIMQVKIGDELIITTDEKCIGKKGIISVKNCSEFKANLSE